MELPIFQIDAFSNRRFGGNPAAVVILEDQKDWLADELLQAIATENNLPGIAFILTCPRPLLLRWFTPKIEVDLCGHATLASAYVLLEHYFRAQSEVQFVTRSGELTVTRRGGLLVMTFRLALADEYRSAMK